MTSRIGDLFLGTFLSHSVEDTSFWDDWDHFCLWWYFSLFFGIDINCIDISQLKNFEGGRLLVPDFSLLINIIRIYAIKSIL